MSSLISQHGRVLLALAMLGCASTAQRSPARLPPCTGAVMSRWPLPASGEMRSLRVWIDAPSQAFDGWGPYGWRRLRVAMAEWNSIRLPLQFVEASSARAADIIVDVLETIPGQTDSDRDQAGVTSLTHEAGSILRARVFVAIAAPYGVRYRVPEQLASLMHELGHALGLPHAPEPSALMAARRVATQLTGADLALARRHYACDPRGPTGT